MRPGDIIRLRPVWDRHRFGLQVVGGDVGIVVSIDEGYASPFVFVKGCVMKIHESYLEVLIKGDTHDNHV